MQEACIFGDVRHEGGVLTDFGKQMGIPFTMGLRKVGVGCRSASREPESCYADSSARCCSCSKLCPWPLYVGCRIEDSFCSKPETFKPL